MNPREEPATYGQVDWHSENASLEWDKDTWQQNVHPDPTAENALHNSRTGFWKLWKPVSRTIPENALVHQSALDRINADIGYNPKNLPKNYTVTTSPQMNPKT